MKVLFVAPGNDIHAIRWINRMVDVGIECVLLNSVPSLELLPCRARIVNISDPFFSSNSRLATSPIKSFQRYLLFRNSIRETIKKESPDLVHLHWLFDLPQLAAARIAKVPIVSTPYGSDLLLYKTPRPSNFLKYLFSQFIAKIIVKHSLYFCCDAVNIKDRLVQLGADPKTVEIIYFGTDVEQFSPALKSKDFKPHLGIPEGNLVVLSNRGLSDVYDVKTFILAAKEALTINHSLSFLIAGGGPLLSQLQQLVDDLGLSSNVLFLGRLSDEDFSLTTGNSDIYVSTSTSDGGLAASVAEAMSCEIPVLITEFGDNSKWLDSESAGYSFSIGNHLELAQLVLKLASDSELRERMGRKGREIINVKNNSRREILKVKGLYEEAIS